MMIKKENISELMDSVFFLSSISQHQSRPNRIMKRRIISIPTLIYIIEGKGNLYINRKNHLAESGKLYFLTPGQVVEGISDCSTPAHFFVLTFKNSLYRDDSESSKMILEGEVSVQNISQVVALLTRIYEKKDSKNPLAHWHQRILFQELIYTIVSDVQIQNENGETSLVVKRAIEYMEDHYMEELSIKDLAEMFGLSPTNFSRLFKAHVGMKPIEFLTEIRINRAKELLSSNQRLKGIATCVGYKDEFYFSRIFKKTVGVSPTIYIKKSHKRIVTLDSNLNDYLVTLGIEPVATLSYEGMSQVNGYIPYIAKNMGQTKIIGSKDQLNYEALLKVNPDLILNIGSLSNNTKELNKIAPTIVTSLEDNWRALLLEYARLVDRKDQAKRWLQEFDKKAERAKSKLSSIVGNHKSVMVLIATKKGFRIYGGKRQIGAILYKELGLKPPRGITLDTHFEYTTIDHIQSLNPDYIFLSTWAADSCEEEMKFLKESEAWSSLVAVKKNQVYEFEHWLNFHAPIKNNITIDKTLEYMIESHH